MLHEYSVTVVRMSKSVFYSILVSQVSGQQFRRARAQQVTCSKEGCTLSVNTLSSQMSTVAQIITRAIYQTENKRFAFQVRVSNEITLSHQITRSYFHILMILMNILKVA